MSASDAATCFTIDLRSVLLLVFAGLGLFASFTIRAKEELNRSLEEWYNCGHG